MFAAQSHSIWSRGVPALFALLSFTCLFAVSPARATQPKLEHLQIVTSTGVHELRVEVARTPNERARGLMFRRSLAEDRGMLFDFGAGQPILMWMKNTYIPLDMIFISREGRVVSITENAEPLSERVISSGAPAYAVIEVNAGTVKRLAIAVGDEVRRPLL